MLTVYRFICYYVYVRSCIFRHIIVYRYGRLACVFYVCVIFLHYTINYYHTNIDYWVRSFQKFTHSVAMCRGKESLNTAQCHMKKLELSAGCKWESHNMCVVWKPKGRRFLHCHPEAETQTKQTHCGWSSQWRQQHHQPVTGMCKRCKYTP